MAERGKPSRVYGLSKEEIAAGKRNPVPEPEPPKVDPDTAYKQGVRVGQQTAQAQQQARSSGSSSRSRPVRLPSVSDNQASITAAFALIAVLLAAKHGWVSALTGWIKKPVAGSVITPPAQPPAATPSTGATAPTRTGPGGIQASPQ